MSSATTENTIESANRDWETAFEKLNLDPSEPQSSTQIRSAAQVGFKDVNSLDAAADVVSEAVDAGHLVRKDSGVVVAGHEPEHVEDDEDSERVGVDESTVTTDTRDDKDIEERVEALQQQNARQAKDIAELQRKNTTLLQAIAEFASPDKNRAVVGELPEAMRGKAKDMNRLSKTITRVNGMLDDLDDMTQERQETTGSRTFQLRRYLVSQAENNGGKFKMNDKAVQSFFNGGEGDDIGRSWASQLINKAADGHNAFTVEKDPKKIVVDADKIDEGSVYRVKNSAGEEGA